jgi:hypothetical protein
VGYKTFNEDSRLYCWSLIIAFSMMVKMSVLSMVLALLSHQNLSSTTASANTADNRVLDIADW